MRLRAGGTEYEQKNTSAYWSMGHSGAYRVDSCEGVGTNLPGATLVLRLELLFSSYRCDQWNFVRPVSRTTEELALGSGSIDPWYIRCLCSSPDRKPRIRER